MPRSTSTVAFPLDLALAQACGRREKAALRTFEQTVLPAAVRAASNLCDATVTAEEVSQAVLERLFVRSDDAPTRIASYDGSVPLVSWARVIARRCAHNLRAVPQWADALGDCMAHLPAFATPEAEVAREAFRAQFRLAFCEALKSLSQRERAVMRLHVADGLTLDEIALAYGVHRATAFRWMATARATVLGKTREGLGRALGPSSHDLDSLLRSAMSGLHLSMGGLFNDLVASVA